jgi:DNA helicase MCM9
VWLLCSAEVMMNAHGVTWQEGKHQAAALLLILLLMSLVCSPVRQAHARLLVRSSVTLQDAVVAVLLADSSMAGASLLGATNALHTHFPADPDQEYLQQEAAVLRGLGLAKQEVGRGGAPGAGWQAGGSGSIAAGGGSSGWHTGSGPPQNGGGPRPGAAAAAAVPGHSLSCGSYGAVRHSQ